MKKLISLTLVLLMCLCALLPAAAQEAPAQETAAPAVNAPLTIDAYKAAYEAVITTILPECTVSWNASPMDEGEAWLAVVNNSFVGVMVLAKDGMADEIAVLMQSDMSETSLMTFLSMAGYAGAALLQDEEVSAEAACEAFIAELYTVFSGILNGEQPEDIYGLNGAINITSVADGTFQYYFILKLGQ